MMQSRNIREAKQMNHMRDLTVTIMVNNQLGYVPIPLIDYTLRVTGQHSPFATAITHYREVNQGQHNN